MSHSHVMGLLDFGFQSRLKPEVVPLVEWRSLFQHPEISKTRVSSEVAESSVI